jgi:hypothetical protein
MSNAWLLTYSTQPAHTTFPLLRWISITYREAHDQEFRNIAAKSSLVQGEFSRGHLKNVLVRHAHRSHAAAWHRYLAHYLRNGIVEIFLGLGA